MPARKEKLGARIEADIIRILSGSNVPLSTLCIADRIGRAWHSVQGHCLRLQIKGRVKGYRISNLNVWELKK